MKKRSAFTLAEILIAMGIIGVIAVFILPLLNNVTPSNEIFRFKKIYYTVQQTTDALLNSNEYPNGTLQTPIFAGGGADNAQRFCENFADLLNVLEQNCSATNAIDGGRLVFDKSDTDLSASNLDAFCGHFDGDPNIKFKTSDGSSWWGFEYDFSNPATDNATRERLDYAVICVDPDSPTGGIEPFAFGIRNDGKIIVGEIGKEILELGGSHIIDR